MVYFYTLLLFIAIGMCIQYSLNSLLIRSADKILNYSLILFRRYSSSAIQILNITTVIQSQKPMSAYSKSLEKRLPLSTFIIQI